MKIRMLMWSLGTLAGCGGTTTLADSGHVDGNVVEGGVLDAGGGTSDPALVGNWQATETESSAMTVGVQMALRADQSGVVTLTLVHGPNAPNFAGCTEVTVYTDWGWSTSGSTLTLRPTACVSGGACAATETYTVANCTDSRYDTRAPVVMPSFDNGFNAGPGQLYLNGSCDYRLNGNTLRLTNGSTITLMRTL